MLDPVALRAAQEKRKGTAQGQETARGRAHQGPGPAARAKRPMYLL